MKTVQALLGHESAKPTLDTYAELFESDLDELGDAMSDAFAATELGPAAHYVLTGAPDTSADVVPLHTATGR